MKGDVKRRPDPLAWLVTLGLELAQSLAALARWMRPLQPPAGLGMVQNKVQDLTCVQQPPSRLSHPVGETRARAGQHVSCWQAPESHRGPQGTPSTHDSRWQHPCSSPPPQETATTGTVSRPMQKPSICLHYPTSLPIKVNNFWEVCMTSILTHSMIVNIYQPPNFLTASFLEKKYFKNYFHTICLFTYLQIIQI